MKTSAAFYAFLLRLLPAYVLIIVLLFSMTCKGRSKEEHYFITKSGEHIELLKVNRFSNDSLLFTTINNRDTVSIIDSLAEYHHIKAGKGLAGFFIGALGGGILGGMLGMALSQPEPTFQSNSLSNSLSSSFVQAASFAAGGTIGFVLGGILGIAIGAGSKKNVNVDMRNYSPDVKKQLLMTILRYEHTP